MAISIGLPLWAAVLCWPPYRSAAPAQPGPDDLWQVADSSPLTPVAETMLSVATAIDLLALALTSGSPLTNALSAVADQSTPVVASQLRQVTAALQWGVDEAKAWQGLPAVWRPAADALALAARVGMPAAGLLREAAATIRRDERQALHERTARLGVLIVLPLGGCFLPAFATLTVLPVVAVIARSVLAGT
ncbi:hypothetical protein AZH51_00445 [Branchiibius sp. NY16-3462-2]|nr:hypothetical protein AZH51_00445 [Branchiibius sp. NY16-3462-2]